MVPTTVRQRAQRTVPSLSAVRPAWRRPWSVVCSISARQEVRQSVSAISTSRAADAASVTGCGMA